MCKTSFRFIFMIKFPMLKHRSWFCRITQSLSNIFFLHHTQVHNVRTSVLVCCVFTCVQYSTYVVCMCVNKPFILIERQMSDILWCAFLYNNKNKYEHHYHFHNDNSHHSQPVTSSLNIERQKYNDNNVNNGDGIYIIETGSEVPVIQSKLKDCQ